MESCCYRPGWRKRGSFASQTCDRDGWVVKHRVWPDYLLVGVSGFRDRESISELFVSGPRLCYTRLLLHCSLGGPFDPRLLSSFENLRIIQRRSKPPCATPNPTFPTPDHVCCTFLHSVLLCVSYTKLTVQVINKKGKKESRKTDQRITWLKVEQHGGKSKYTRGACEGSQRQASFSIAQ